MSEYTTKLCRSEYFKTPGEALKAYRETFNYDDVNKFLTWFFETLELTKEEYEQFQKEHPCDGHSIMLNSMRFIEGFKGTNEDIIDKYIAEVPDTPWTIERVATWLFLPLNDNGLRELQTNCDIFCGAR